MDTSYSLFIAHLLPRSLCMGYSSSHKLLLCIKIYIKLLMSRTGNCLIFAQMLVTQAGCSALIALCVCFCGVLFCFCLFLFWNFGSWFIPILAWKRYYHNRDFIPVMLHLFFAHRQQHYPSLEWQCPPPWEVELPRWPLSATPPPELVRLPPLLWQLPIRNSVSSLALSQSCMRILASLMKMSSFRPSKFVFRNESCTS